MNARDILNVFVWKFPFHDQEADLSLLPFSLLIKLLTLLMHCRQDNAASQSPAAERQHGEPRN
jgi:hypothetical protein